MYGNISVLGNFEITDHLYKNCKFYVLHDKEPVKIGEIKITPFEVAHTTPTYGLLFRQNGKRIVHFSDKADSNLSDLQKKLIKNSDIAIFHTPCFQGEETAHVDVKSVMNIAKRYPSTRFIITHIGHNNLSHEELVEKLSPYENIIVAYDGLEVLI